MYEFARLKFLPSSTPEGFASKAVSSDNDANPSVVVRELIQNSLDAGYPSGSPVHVDFVFAEMPVSEAAPRYHLERLQTLPGSIAPLSTPRNALTPTLRKQPKHRSSV